MTPEKPKELLVDAFFLLTGAVCAAFGLESLLLPANFIDGGVTGICLLINEVTDVRLSVLLLIVNVPFLALAYRTIGSRFALKSGIGIGLLAGLLFFAHFPMVSNDKLLVSIFGGFFLGTGIGLSMRGGGVLDGTEILAVALSRRTPIKVSDWVILINLFIFGAAAYVLTMEQALYSLLTYIVATKALDFIIDGIEEYTAVMIISRDPEPIRRMLTEELGYGVTVFHGTGGYRTGEPRSSEVLYTVITRLEIRKLTLEVEHIDPQAFITMSTVNDLRGGMVRRKEIGN